MERSKLKQSFYLKTFVLLVLLIGTAGFFTLTNEKVVQDNTFVTYKVNPKKNHLEFFWRDAKGNNFQNARNLIEYLKPQHKKLLFATNGGMYTKDGAPQGLYIEKGILKKEIDTANGNGNFYLKPNGVFYLTKDNQAFICTTPNFKMKSNIKYATQSGPMLVIDGNIHPEFKKNSTRVNVRNGVGILPNNEVVFVLSKKEVNLYDFAAYFKSLGCQNALYLDGFVSRTYLPEQQWEQTDGNFGVMIGVVK